MRGSCRFVPNLVPPVRSLANFASRLSHKRTYRVFRTLPSTLTTRPSYSHFSAMALLSYLAGFSALGFGVRCYQLAILKRNIFENLGGHALSTGAFAGVGYWVYNTEIYQRQLIAEKKEQLLRMREKDEANIASHTPSASAHHH